MEWTMHQKALWFNQKTEEMAAELIRVKAEIKRLKTEKETDYNKGKMHELIQQRNCIERWLR